MCADMAGLSPQASTDFSGALQPNRNYFSQAPNADLCAILVGEMMLFELVQKECQERNEQLKKGNVLGCALLGRSGGSFWRTTRVNNFG